MLNKEFIQRKLLLNQRDLERLGEYGNLEIEEVAHDPGRYAACERYIERIIGRALDINQHIIAEKGSVELGAVRYRDTFLILADIGVYPREFAEKIAPSAGLRNALVHDYNNLDREILKKSVGHAIAEYNQYASYIMEFTEMK